MKIHKTLAVSALAMAMLFCPGTADSGKKDDIMVIVPDIRLIDVPTSGILDYYGFLFTTRFFSGGGVMGSLKFGVMERLNLGASMLVEKFIGSESGVKMRSPEIQVKFRFYDGGYYLPGLALGFDGQGYFYDSASKEYMQKSRGLYIAGSKEALWANFVLHGGLNVPDFDDGYVFGFLGANYIIEERFAVMAEYDNLFHSNDPSRFNLGTRFYITPYFYLDLAMRDIGRNDTFPNGAAKKTERIVQLKYNTSF